jgi:IclR family acetate operon transcriptional repressor
MSEAATGTLGKLVSLLELISTSQQPLRFIDVVKLSKQPRATVHRQLSHLMAEGLLEQCADQSYVPGLLLLTFASKAWARNDLRSVAAPFLQQLHQQTGESVHLAVLQGVSVIYLDKIDGTQKIRMHSQIGNRSPAFCTGVGKAALSLLSDDELAERLATIDFHRFTPQTLASPQELTNDIAQIRLRGFAHDMEEHEVGIRCVAAPIGILSGGNIGAISITAPAFRVTEEQLKTWEGLISATTARIAQGLEAALSPGKISL